MRFKVVVLALVALFATSAVASAQSQTGEIFGKVTDGTGGVLPGVTVTVTGPVLLQPLTAVTGSTGTFQFPRVEIGEYSVKFELAGFKTVVNQGIRVTVGFSAARQRAAGYLHRPGNHHGHRREPDRRHQEHRDQADVHQRAAAEHPVGARPLGHPPSRPPASR